MKYIRTKDGVFELDNCAEKFYESGSYSYPLKNKGTIREYEILKQANTIEELCDCYILVSKNDNTRLVYNRSDYNALKYKIALDEWVIYDAIWTDKGLIYVAKLNEKGELELL